MKKYKIMALLTALLLMLTACNTGDVKETVDKAKNDVEKVKQTVESAKESYDKIIEMTKTLNDLKGLLAKKLTTKAYGYFFI